MDQDEASRLIADVDRRDHAGRAERLTELMELLPHGGMVGFSGQAAQWLFEDVKATWLYGCFTSTVVTAHAFCLIQVAGEIRLLLDDPSLPTEVNSLEHLTALAVEAGALSIDLQARLIDLDDRHRAYTAVRLHEYEPRLEHHLAEAEALGGGHPLLLDARSALTTAARLLYRRNTRR